jgi:hypothetical protein
MNSNQVVKKCAVMFVLAVLPLLTVILILLSGMMAVKISEDQKTIISLMQERDRTANQLTVVLSELVDTKVKLNAVEYKLSNAILPQATVSEAFQEKVSKPVVETTKALWTNVTDNSKRAWNYVFP